MGAEHTLERTQVVAATPPQAFAFFSEPGNLEAITPPWLRFRIEEAPVRLELGSFLRYRLRLGGIPVHWLTEIVGWHPPRGFTDVQREGPYRLWEHTHRLRQVGTGTEIYDHVRYRLSGEPLATWLRPLTVALWLDQIFDYRSRAIGVLLG